MPRYFSPQVLIHCGDFAPAIYQPMSRYLSPQVLIHCGDFAPGPIWPNGEPVRPDEAQARLDS